MTLLSLARSEAKLGSDIRDVQNLTLKNGSSDKAIVERSARKPLAVRREQARIAVMVRDEMDELTVETEHDGKRGVTQSDCAPHHRVEGRLHIGRRLTDHPQDLAGRRLLLQRFPKALLKVADPSASILGRLASCRRLHLNF